MSNVTYRTLYDGLSERRMPYDVAADIREFLPDVAADHLPKRPSWYGSWRTAMNVAFDQAASLDKPLRVLGEITETVPPKDGRDPVAIAAYLDTIRPLIAAEPGKTSFKTDRLDRKARKAAGLVMSRRQYDKLFRLIGRLDGYVGELVEQNGLARLARFAKIGFTADVTFRDFSRNRPTAAFIAYYAANLARRSLFLAGPQARAFDDAAKALFAECEATPGTSWFAIAHTFPREDVLARLTVDQRATLLDMTRGVLEECATGLREQAARSTGLKLDTMVVARGNDSSTWNALAGSWNKARDLWIAISWSLDPALTDAFLPGKVLRLMAADVAAWHRAKGGGLDPDTAVWGLLPRPWEVFEGTAQCGRREVIAACEKVQVDPAKSGWAKPRPRTTVAMVVPTPESVHGVVVGHPELAKLLRRAGYFSGQATAKELPFIEVERDEYGFAIGVGTK